MLLTFLLLYTQAIQEIPSQTRELYKTAWEIKQRAIIDMAADRSIYSFTTSLLLYVYLSADQAARKHRYGSINMAADRSIYISRKIQ